MGTIALTGAARASVGPIPRKKVDRLDLAVGIRVEEVGFVTAERGIAV